MGMIMVPRYETKGIFSLPFCVIIQSVASAGDPPKHHDPYKERSYGFQRTNPTLIPPPSSHGRCPPPLSVWATRPVRPAPPGCRSLSHSAVVGPFHAPRCGGQSTGIVWSSGKAQRTVSPLLFSHFRGPVFLVMDSWPYFFSHGKFDQEDSPFSAQ